MRTILLVSLFMLAGSAIAEDAVAEFQRALPDNNADAKRQAIRDLMAAGLPDAVVLPLLVAAVSDRQVHLDAVQALRQRTGLQPPIYRGQSSYPDYPPSDHPLSWQYWLHDWQREHDQESRIDAALQHAREADAAATKALDDARSED